MELIHLGNTVLQWLELLLLPAHMFALRIHFVPLERKNSELGNLNP